jgi:hypothetical protein
VVASGPPVRIYLRGGDPLALFGERRAEDAAVLAGLGAAVLHLEHVDALFRRRRLLGRSAPV